MVLSSNRFLVALRAIYGGAALPISRAFGRRGKTKICSASSNVMGSSYGRGAVPLFGCPPLRQGASQMKAAFNISAVAVLLVALPGVCLALWDLDVVTKERAKELGMDVRLTAVGSKHMKVEVEFKEEGALKKTYLFTVSKHLYTAVFPAKTVAPTRTH